MWLQTYSKLTEHFQFDDGEVDITTDTRKRLYYADVILNDGTEFLISQSLNGSSAEEFSTLMQKILEKTQLSEQ